MKKATLLIVVAVLCLFFKVNGQQGSIKTNDKKVYHSLKIGDRIPDMVFNVLYNSDIKKISTKDLFGKAIIIDFWATWCTGCVAGFPHLEELQATYKKNLQVLMVNNSNRDSLEKINSFFSKRKADGYVVSIPGFINEKSLDMLFPHRSIPHYIMIGPDGRVKAITDADGITEESIKRLIAGLNLDLKVKEG